MPAGLDGNPNPIVSPARAALITRVAEDVAEIAGHRTLVAVDGASGTGKSTFADELARTLETAGRIVMRASVDSFHRPRAERYRLGNDSPEGYYRDSHDLAGLRDKLLEPFAAGFGSVPLAIFDEPSDTPLEVVEEAVPAEAILLVDGLFLHRPELVECWDLSVYLLADGRREASWQDYLTRDLPEDPNARADEIDQRVTRARRRRYVEGQALYEREAGPLHQANLVIDNDDLAHPELSVRPPSR